MSGKIAICLVAALAIAGSAQAAATAAARIESTSGAVVAIGARGAASAQAGQALSKGDRIVARTGSARLRYADGCVVALKAGAMATIGQVSPCAGGAGLVNTQQADPAAFMDALRHPDTGTILAGLGSAVLAVAVVDGVINPDKRCNPSDTGCEPESP